MKCDAIRDLFPDFWAEALDENTKADFQSHLANCPSCRDENESLSTVWMKLGEFPEEGPSAALRPRFYAMLEGYQQGLDQAKLSRRWRDAAKDWLGKLSFRRPAFQLGFAAVLLMVGFLGGYVYKPTASNHRDELAQLREEVHDMRQMVTVSLLKQQSASERLKGVSWSNQVIHPDPELLSALLQTLNYDPNVDVRLASIDALYRFSSEPSVRKALIETLPRQDSPLVQIAVIDLLVQLQERQSIDVLKQLTRDQDLNKVVRERAQWGLQKLS
ncbi:MAG: HEAT repeat domain-containing protein [Terriglobia bacterium]